MNAVGVASLIAGHLRIQTGVNRVPFVAVLEPAIQYPAFIVGLEIESVDCTEGESKILKVIIALLHLGGSR